MVNRVNVPPPPAETDARNRAWRTLAQGLVLDLAAGAVVGLIAVTSKNIEWTQAYWVAGAGAIGKSIILAGVSYLARRLRPPPAL